MLSLQPLPFPLLPPRKKNAFQWENNYIYAVTIHQMAGLYNTNGVRAPPQFITVLCRTLINAVRTREVIKQK